MRKTILLKPIHDYEVLNFKNDLDFYYDKIECDCIDIVSPYVMNDMSKKFKSKHFCLIVDDEGLLVQNPKMNVIASMAYGNRICGNVLVCREKMTPDGVITIGLTDDDINVFFKTVQGVIDLVKGV